MLVEERSNIEARRWGVYMFKVEFVVRLRRIRFELENSEILEWRCLGGREVDDHDTWPNMHLVIASTLALAIPNAHLRHPPVRPCTGLLMRNRDTCTGYSL